MKILLITKNVKGIVKSTFKNREKSLKNERNNKKTN